MYHNCPMFNILYSIMKPPSSICCLYCSKFMKTAQEVSSLISYLSTQRTIIISEHLSARLLILQCMSSVGRVWCHASGMQFVTVRNTICHTQECNLSHSGMQLKDPVYKNLCTQFIILSTVAAVAVSLLRRQNGDGTEKERARSLARKWKRRQRAQLQPQRHEIRVEKDEYERDQQRLA